MAEVVSIDVLVGGVPLEEKLLPDGRRMVGSPFDAATTYQQPEEETNRYGETYTQSWPVTPYSIRVAYLGWVNPAESVQVKLFVDGTLAGTEYLGGRYNDTYVFEGFGANPTRFIASKDQTTEFLFVLPRPRPEALDKAPKTPDELAALLKANSEAGSIRIEMYQASFHGENNVTNIASGGYGSGSVGAIGKNAAKAARVTAASASGKAIGHQTAYSGPSVTIGQLIKTKTIHYATIHKLNDLLNEVVAGGAGSKRRKRKEAQKTADDSSSSSSSSSPAKKAKPLEDSASSSAASAIRIGGNDGDEGSDDDVVDLS